MTSRLTHRSTVRISAVTRWLLIVGLASAASPLQAQGPPPLVPVAGALVDATGTPRTGVVALTFTLYEEPIGGTPLWTEQQQVTLNADGRYSVALGATTSGLPVDMFRSGTARWLGVRLAGEPEEPRSQLLAVPYAIAANEAATLNGRPAADFARAAALKETVDEVVAAEADRLAGDPSTGIQATVNQIPKFTSSGGAVDDSALTDAGGFIGVGTTTPNYLFQIHAPTGPVALQITTGSTGSGASDGVRLLAPSAEGTFSIVNQEAAPVEFYTNATRRMTIDAAGKVGIGVDAPNYLMQLNSSGSHALVQLTNSTTGSTFGDGSYFGVLAGDPTFRIMNQEIGGVELFTGGDLRLAIDGNGQVGLGTRAPASLFHLHAPFGHTLLQFTNSTTGSTPGDGPYIGLIAGSRVLRIANQESGWPIELHRGNLAISINAGAGNLEIHMPNRNTAIGAGALDSVVLPSLLDHDTADSIIDNNTADSTAVGEGALTSFVQGEQNTAFGYHAMFGTTTGTRNTAMGALALEANMTGSDNVAFGEGALAGNLDGSRNVAVGRRALAGNRSGNDNIAIGRFAGTNQTTGSHNIYIGNRGLAGESGRTWIGTMGTHTHTVIGGIRGVTTGIGDAVTLVVDSNGHLGTIASSARYKEHIADMGAASRGLLRLRPVAFRYRQPDDSGSKPLHYGLIAEEVAHVLPGLVVFDTEGRPETVQYHKLDVMLLNELQEQQRRIDAAGRAAQEQDARIAADGAELEARRRQLQDLAARLTALTRR
jgi:hypothetical protein